MSRSRLACVDLLPHENYAAIAELQVGAATQLQSVELPLVSLGAEVGKHVDLCEVGAPPLLSVLIRVIVFHQVPNSQLSNRDYNLFPASPLHDHCSIRRKTPAPSTTLMAKL